MKPSYRERVNVNAAKKQRLVTAKFMTHKETLLREWDNEIRKRAKSLLDTRRVWLYYRERQGDAQEVGLLEEFHNMCLHYSHKNTHGTSIGAKKYVQ